MTTVVAVLLLATVGADPLGPGDHSRMLTVGELKRSYLVHIPPRYDAKKPTPVVLAFHGGGANADNMVVFSGLNKKSDEAGFLVVYPSGTGRLEKVLTFNGGNCCGYAMNNRVDDVEFTRRILDDLAKSANIDAKRIFATGMSNGGIMAYRFKPGSKPTAARPSRPSRDSPTKPRMAQPSAARPTDRGRMGRRLCWWSSKAAGIPGRARSRGRGSWASPPGTSRPTT